MKYTAEFVSVRVVSFSVPCNCYSHCPWSIHQEMERNTEDDIFPIAPLFSLRGSVIHMKSVMSHTWAGDGNYTSEN